MTRSTSVRRRLRDAAEAAARFVRLFSLGATLLYLLVGLATGPVSAPAGAVVLALLIGLLFHVHADVANDVMDLPIDRTDPRRAPDPLVRGTVSPQHALAVAVAAIPLMLACVLVWRAGQALGPLVWATLLIGAYNIAGKAVPLPIVADVVEGAGCACLVFAGAALAGGPTAATWWAAGVALLYIAMVNGLHGAIRDVQNDMRAGARTTAVLLGARILHGQSVSLPRLIVVYATVLQAAIGAVLAGFLVSWASPFGPAWAVSAAGTGIVFGASTVALHRAYRARNDLRRAMAAGAWHLFLVPASLLCAAAWRLPAWAVGPAVATFVAPPLLFGLAVRGTSFGLPGTTARTAPPPARTRGELLAALWRMTRIGTPLAAAALAGVGAALSGTVDGSAALLAIIATALSVAAANVYNDRCDLVADTISHPHRPIPACVVSGSQADRFVLAAALGAVAAAAAIGAAAALVASTLLVVALGYSLLLRRIVVIGQLAVAVLFAAPLLYGGWAGSAGLVGEHWVAASLAALFVLARETLKGIPDRLGDLAAGYRTIATEFGVPVALSVFRVAAVAFCAGAVAAGLVVDDLAYFAAAFVCAVAPTARALWLVRGSPSLAAINTAISFSGWVFALGVLPLILMR